MKLVLPALASVLLSACGGVGVMTDGPVGSDPSIWGQAELEVLSPQSGEVLFVEDAPHSLTAQVVDAEGVVQDWDAIQWAVSSDPDWSETGTEVTAFLPTGRADLETRTTLPNGDRLVWVSGGLRVQGRFTGVYAGSIEVRITLNSQNISGSCIGALDFVVDWDGQGFVGPSSCTLETGIFPVNVDMELDGTILDPVVNGDLNINVGSWFQVPVSYDGSVVSADELMGSFGYQGNQVTVDGTWEAHRLSSDIGE